MKTECLTLTAFYPCTSLCLLSTPAILQGPAELWQEKAGFGMLTDDLAHKQTKFPTTNTANTHSLLVGLAEEC